VLQLTVVAIAEVQEGKKVPRIGFLGNSTAALEANLVEPFREGLRDLGYIEGKNILIEYRWAEGKYKRFPELIGELIHRKAAKKIGVTVPPLVLYRTDKIIR
jgi:putative ABC transport system substrate-binding protein